MIWVAEIGSMHKGDKSLAFELIRQAAQAGATIAKFQFGWTEETQRRILGNYNPIRFVDEWADDLNKWCQYFGIELMASIWSMEGLEAARKVRMKRYKIAHQMKNDALIHSILSDGKETFWSGRYGANWFQTNFRRVWVSENYPTYPAELKMRPYFDAFVDGYSDHTHGIEACLLAIARGAMYIEKHFCLSKADLTVRDTPFSATPDEFAEMVRIGNGMRRLLDVNV